MTMLEAMLQDAWQIRKRHAAEQLKSERAIADEEKTERPNLTEVVLAKITGEWKTTNQIRAETKLCRTTVGRVLRGYTKTGLLEGKMNGHHAMWRRVAQ
jgi:hypothetical protein